MDSIAFATRPLIVILLCAGIAACASTGPEANLLGGGRVTSASADQMFEPSFEGFDDEALLHLLDPEDKSGATQWTGEFANLSKSERTRRLQDAFRAANQDYGLAHRAQIQDRLIAASDQRCNLYATYLKRVSTYTNGVFGTLTTVLGGAGAIVTGADAARLLSGLAGISSGIRAELNQAIFESVATSVIVPGIKKQREALLDKILAKRRMKPSLEEYTVEGAIADAIRYHGACSIDAGIEYAQKSIQSFDDIGVRKFIEIQRGIAMGRDVSEGLALGAIPAAVISAKSVLRNFADGLDALAADVAKLDTGKPEQKRTAQEFSDAQASVASGGDLEKQAAELDAALAGHLMTLATTTGADRAAAAKQVEAQQVDARGFQKKLQATLTKLEIEIKEHGT